jgi:hypothetical protein
MSDKNINQMDFKELRNEVQLLRDELAIMQRKYEDIIYNLDNENFSGTILKEKEDMKTKIVANENGISTLVSRLGNYSTISQTNSKIAMVVSKSVSAKFTMNEKPTWTNTDQEQKGMICEYNDTLYYYNNLSRQWEECAYPAEIKSLFEQTSDGFNLVGIVSVCGKILAHDGTEGDYTEMSRTGLDVYANYAKKIGMGYTESDGDILYDFPYITLGVGTNPTTSENVGCVYKLANGLWIGDASITKGGGDYPGGKSSATDISATYKQATGIFIDLTNEKIYKYLKGVPTELSSLLFG